MSLVYKDVFAAWFSTYNPEFASNINRRPAVPTKG
jgi:hypothetical protein